MKRFLIKSLTAVLLINTLFGEENSEILIWQAAAEGDTQLIKKHLSDGVNVNAKDERGWTSLHYSAGFGRKEIVELLITAGADVNAKEEDGDTPLDKAKYKPQRNSQHNGWDYRQTQGHCNKHAH